MNNEQVLKFKAWFCEYVSGFYGTDPEQNQIYKLKEMHTLRVCENILKIGKSIHLSPEDLKIAEISALFHDLGRFKQYLDYGTFNDKKSVNHARMSIQQLSLHKVLKDLSTPEKRFIVTSIGWHNAYRLPDIKNDKMLLFIKLLRDADKLDIWKVVIDHYTKDKNQETITVLLDLPDNGQEYSKEIIKALYDGQLAQTRHLACLTDLKLLQISWVYDLNFTESFRLLRQSGFIETLGQTLPETKQIKGAVKTAIRHIEKMALISSLN
jgi:hypothetical protein